MHARGIAHRDLKLENVLLKKPPSGKGHRHCKVADFGLSRECFSPRSGITMYSGHAGTRPYMAPEIVEWSVARETATKYNPMACDIWALGVCLYCMLTASYPFQKAELARMRDKGPRMPRSLSIECQELILSMLCPHPAKRITTRGILAHEWATANNGRRRQPLTFAAASPTATTLTTATSPTE